MARNMQGDLPLRGSIPEGWCGNTLWHPEIIALLTDITTMLFVAVAWRSMVEICYPWHSLHWLLCFLWTVSRGSGKLKPNNNISQGSRRRSSLRTTLTKKSLLHDLWHFVFYCHFWVVYGPILLYHYVRACIMCFVFFFWQQPELLFLWGVPCILKFSSRITNYKSSSI